MNWALYGVAAFLVQAIMYCILTIGKPKKPTTNGQALFVVVVLSILAAICVAGGLRLS